MLNLLPPFKGLSGKPSAGNNKSSRKRVDIAMRQWDPTSSVALDDKIPPYFDVLPTFRARDSLPAPKIDIAEEKVMALPPNERYTVNHAYTTADPSPLSYSERGVPDRPAIVVPLDQQAQSKDPALRRHSSEGIKCLAIRTTNMTEEPLTIFIQKLSSSIEVVAADPGRSTTNIVRGNPSNEGKMKDTMHCVFTKTDETVLQLNSTQDIFAMQFECRPLGLVLEMRNDKIICARVLEDSQAVGHETILVGAEIIAVDDQRISTLEDFQFIVSSLKARGVGPRLQFVRSDPKKSAIRDGGSSGSSGLVSRSGLNTRGNTSCGVGTDIKAFDDDNGLIAAVKVNRQPSDAWTYATSFGINEEENIDDDDDDELGSKILVCVPPNMSKKGWGAPTALMQLAHLSSNWISAELHWIDEGGALIFRKTLRMGDRHSELTSADHVWLLNVIRRDSSSDSSGGNEQFAFIFQPCHTALRKSKMTTIVWIPRKSVTLSQRDTTPTGPLHKQKISTAYVDDPELAPPVLQIQIL